MTGFITYLILALPRALLDLVLGPAEELDYNPDFLRTPLPPPDPILLEQERCHT